MAAQRLITGVVAGTRPEAIKLAPVVQGLRRSEEHFQCKVIITGQHRQMLDQVLSLFRIQPDADLAIMTRNQSLEQVVIETLSRLPDVLRNLGIQLLIVQGDTSTAFAAALAGFYLRIPVAHVEAGLRTYDKFNPFPEEINRRLITPLADIHFAPTALNQRQLEGEGTAPDSIFVTGNTVIDALLMTSGMHFTYDDPSLREVMSRPTRKLLVTAHRRENLGEPLTQICQALLALARAHRDVDIIYPVHLNPQVQTTVHELLAGSERITLVQPLDYETFVHAMKHAHLVLTDSGGVQEEAPSLGKPVLVLRETTERPEAVSAGTVKLIGTSVEAIVREVSVLLTDPSAYRRMARAINPYGDGQAANRTVAYLQHRFFAAPRPEAFNPSWQGL